MTRSRFAAGLRCIVVLSAGMLFLPHGVSEAVAAESLQPAVAGAVAALPTRPSSVSSEVLARFGEGPADVARWETTTGYRSDIERVWFNGYESPAARATQTRIRALELGAANLEAAAMALVVTAKGGDELDNARLAAQLAPDLPLAQMAEAKALFAASEYEAALSSGWQSLATIPKHLEGSLWVVGSILLIIGVVLTVGSMTFICVVGASVLHHAAHDLGDLVSSAMPGFARAALVAAAILLPVALGEGALGLTLGLLAVGLVYAGSRMRMAMGLAAALILIGAYPIMRLAGVALTAFDGDRVGVAIYAVIQGFESPSDIELLRRSATEDALAAHALALHARRNGRNALAYERYTALLKQHPRDPIALANLGNLHFGAGETEAAIDAYKRAAAGKDSATVMFNLSQAYARAFRMEEFERTMQIAQSFDPDRVAMLSSISSADFVADVPIPASTIRDRLLEAANGDAFASHFVRRFAPGRLGGSAAVAGGAFVLIALLGTGIGSRFESSSRCGRCGRRICTRCDGTVWSSEICDPCHHLFNKPESTDPALRHARIAQLRERERRVARYETLAAVLIPGAGGLLAKRPDLGIVGVLLFGFAVASFVWHRGVVPDPLAVGAAGPLALLIGAVAASLAYAAVVLRSLVIRRSS